MVIDLYPNIKAADVDTTPVRKDTEWSKSFRDLTITIQSSGAQWLFDHPVLSHEDAYKIQGCTPERRASIIIYCTVLHVPASRPSSSRNSTECHQTIPKATAYPANGKRSNSMQISNRLIVLRLQCDTAVRTVIVWMLYWWWSHVDCLYVISGLTLLLLLSADLEYLLIVFDGAFAGGR